MSIIIADDGLTNITKPNIILEINTNSFVFFGSKKVAATIDQLEQEYDMVCLDSPPLVAVTDATLISKEIDGLILVTKSGGTDKNAFTRTLLALKNVDVPLTGVVLNGVTSKNSYGSYYYYYQYYHYYGDK